MDAIYIDPVAQAQDMKATALNEAAIRVLVNKTMEAVELERELGNDRRADYWLQVLNNL